MKLSRLRKCVNNIISFYEPYDNVGLVNKIREYRNKNKVIPENEQLESAPNIYYKWPNLVTKPYVALVKSERGNNAYWPKFERFLKTNSIPYKEIDIKASNFISESKKFDIIVWRTPSPYVDQWEAADKVDFIEDYLGKMVLPSKQSLWMYEDKVREQWLLELNKLPVIKTFISYSKEETKKYIDTCKYPLISKDKTCSSSEGVKLVKNKNQARKLWRKVFFRGLKIDNTYVKQKNYVYFQEFIPNKGFDLRVIIVGNFYFGYYRYPKKNDYRASGSGLCEKKDIPIEALLLAKKVKECLPKSYLLAVDFLQDTRDDKYYIIETSIFIAIESSEQLFINGVPGRYIESNGKFTFESGRFWIQELMMEELMNNWIKRNLEKKK